MRLSTPRLAPVEAADWTPEQAELMAPMARRGGPFNIFKTLVRDPTAYRAFMAWGGYILSADNGLKPRERELAILRTGYHGRSAYEWGQHVVIGKRAGLTDAEIEAIKQGPDASIWGEADAAILRAVDELSRDRFITDDVWAALGRHFDDKQRADLVLTVGQYTQVCMILNSFGVQPDPGLVVDPDLDGR